MLVFCVFQASLWGFRWEGACFSVELGGGKFLPLFGMFYGCLEGGTERWGLQVYGSLGYVFAGFSGLFDCFRGSSWGYFFIGISGVCALWGVGGGLAEC